MEITFVVDGKKGRVPAGQEIAFSRAEAVKAVSLPWKNAHLWPHNILLPLNRGKGPFSTDKDRSASAKGKKPSYRSGIEKAELI